LANPGDPSQIDPANYVSAEKYTEFVRSDLARKGITDLPHDWRNFSTNATLGTFYKIIVKYILVFFKSSILVFSKSSIFVYLILSYISLFISDCAISLGETMARRNRKNHKSSAECDSFYQYP
jgi:hypothetical protein